MTKPSDEQQLALSVELAKALDAAWDAGLRFTGCIGCARKEIAERVAGHAQATEWWIIGTPSSAAVPTRREGVSMTCRDCAGAKR